MSDTNDRAPLRDSVQKGCRKCYRTPVLAVYGPLRDLTAGGSGVMAEGMQMLNPLRFP